MLPQRSAYLEFQVHNRSLCLLFDTIGDKEDIDLLRKGYDEGIFVQVLRHPH